MPQVNISNDFGKFVNLSRFIQDKTAQQFSSWVLGEIARYHKSKMSVENITSCLINNFVGLPAESRHEFRIGCKLAASKIEMIRPVPFWSKTAENVLKALNLKIEMGSEVCSKPCPRYN